MTCVAAVVDRGRVYIGSDSAGVSDTELITRRDPKVWVAGDFVYGFAGSFRAAQVIRHVFEPPEHGPKTSLETYMVRDYIDALRECLRESGVRRRKDDVDELPDTGLLVGYRGAIFNVESDFQVGRSLYDFDAAGCGRDIALGVLAVTAKLSPIVRLRKTLQVAEMFSAGVRLPAKIVSGGAR